MDVASSDQVKAWCLANGFHPNRALGQNFLVDVGALEGIADAAGVNAGDTVLEVGPGLGVLTECLLARGVHVYAIEKDTRLADRLKANVEAELAARGVAAPGTLTLVAADALKTDWDALFASRPFAACVSNLPYSVGTRILLDIARNPAAPPVLTVLVQTEVAQRFAAVEGEKPRGQAGVWLQLDFDVRIVREVAPTCFWPKPEVGSSVVRLDRHPCSLTPSERAVFYMLTKSAFMHRRKQLGGFLRKQPQFPGALDALAAVDIPPTARAEELSNAQWLALSKNLKG